METNRTRPEDEEKYCRNFAGECGESMGGRRGCMVVVTDVEEAVGCVVGRCCTLLGVGGERENLGKLARGPRLLEFEQVRMV